MGEIEQVIPVLVCEDMQAAHDFLIEAFGFTSGGVHRDGEGRVVHAEVRAGQTVIYLHRAGVAGLASPRSASLSSSGLVVHVANVDVHCDRARARRARIDSEPQDMPYGVREYAARDSEGHRFWFTSKLGTAT